MIAQIIIITLFFGVIIVLVVLAIFGSLKEKRRKSIKDFEQQKIRESTKSDRFEMMIRFSLYTDFLNSFLEEFDPLKGTISLGKVNAYGTNMLEEIATSEELKEIFKDEIRKEELKEHIEALRGVKPSDWSKKRHESFNILKAKSDLIAKNIEYKEIVEKVSKKYEMKFS